MGQGNSRNAHPPSQAELALRLTNVFAGKCFSVSELRSFEAIFNSLAGVHSDGARYWPEAAFAKFLELPDVPALALYQLCGHLGAFPFASSEPALLTADALLRVVCFMTDRYLKVLDTRKEAWIRELWKSCAEFEPESSASAVDSTSDLKDTNGGSIPAGGGQPVTITNQDHDGTEGDEDELSLQILELVDALDGYRQDKKTNLQHASVPSDKLIKLLQLLLLLAPLERDEEVSFYTNDLSDERWNGLMEVSNCILDSFGTDQKSGVEYEIFDTVVTNTLPSLFDSFVPLFEKFVVSEKSLGNIHRNLVSPMESSSPLRPEAIDIPIPEPLLHVQGDILDLNLLSQLSFIFSSHRISHRLHPLYLGHKHGYSMGSFEKSTSKWHAPTILLLSGTIISPVTKQSNARAFLDELPHRRLPSSVQSSEHESQRVIYGAFISAPWEAANNSTFETNSTTLFQLSPIHDVFPAYSGSQIYTYFNKPPSLYPGLGFGSPLQTYSSMTASQQFNSSRRPSVTEYSAQDTAYSSRSYSERTSSFSGSSSPGLTRRSSLIGDESVPIGPISLHIDAALEFAVFTHIASSVSSASFQPSKLPSAARYCNGSDWQDRLDIDAIEVWGVGDASVAEE